MTKKQNHLKHEKGEKIAEMLESKYEINVAGTKLKAEPSMKPLYDPKSERVIAD